MLQCLKEVFDNEILRMSFGKAVEVDKKIVPGLLEVIAVLESLESEERCAPSEGGYEIFI